MNTRAQSSLLDMTAPLSARKARTVDPDGYKIVSVRLRMAEYEAFCEQVEALGTTSSQALRIATRRIAGFLEIDRETRLLLEQVVSEIGTLSRSIGTLHVDYVQSHAVDMATFLDARKAFAEDFALLDTRICQIRNVSNRRSDGRHLLSDEMDA